MTWETRCPHGRQDCTNPSIIHWKRLQSACTCISGKVQTLSNKYSCKSNRTETKSNLDKPAVSRVVQHCIVSVSESYSQAVRQLSALDGTVSPKLSSTSSWTRGSPSAQRHHLYLYFVEISSSEFPEPVYVWHMQVIANRAGNQNGDTHPVQNRENTEVLYILLPLHSITLNFSL